MPGRGSKFWFTVALKKHDAGLARKAVRARAAEPAPPAQGELPGGTRVLVVEDNEGNQAVARLMLEKLGCQVFIVGDGREGVKAVAGGGFDIVYMDCHMPVMDGLEATT